MISRRDALSTWFRIGIFSFGGPAGQIALMHKVLVEEKHWVDEKRFMHALNYCMLLPGPEAMQLATYIGWLLHKTWGGVVAGLLFVLPGFLVMLALSATYAAFHAVPLVSAVFFGIKCAVLVIVIEALLRIGKRALHNAMLVALAALSFIAIFFLHIPFPLVIVAAAAAGLAGNRFAPQLFAQKQKDIKEDKAKSVVDKMAAAGLLAHTVPDRRRDMLTILAWLAIWLLPVAGLFVWNADSVLAQLAVFLSKMAVVTFGGAYAALTYVAQEAVQNFKWLSAEDMMNGLGLAETTPGPLILVLEYVGFMAAYKQGGMLAGVAGAVIAAWVTFAPCFLWIFAGAPYIERIRGNKAVSAVLSAITAAVTGVILNLAVWFGLHVTINKGQPDFYALGIAAVAAAMTFWLKRNMLETLGVCAVLGGALKLI
jgi:chromate transporter